MNSDFNAIADSTSTERAHRVLDDLMARVGVDGLTAALAHPGLLAHLDQHGAAVREAVRRSGRRITPETLAGYGGSVAAAAHRMGRAIPAPGEADLPGVDWLHAEWHLLRLLAVCAMAEECGWL